MENYELRLYREDGTLICVITTPCADDEEARALIDGMRVRGYEQLEIWRGETKIFGRRDPPRDHGGQGKPS